MSVIKTPRKKKISDKESVKVRRSLMQLVRSKGKKAGYSIGGFVESAVQEKLDRLGLK